MAKERDAEKHLRRERAQRAVLDFPEAAALARANDMNLVRQEDWAYQLSGVSMTYLPDYLAERMNIRAADVNESTGTVLAAEWSVMLFPTTYRWTMTSPSSFVGPKFRYLRPGWRLADAVQLATEKGQQKAALAEAAVWRTRREQAEQEFPIAHDLAADNGMVLTYIADHIGPRYLLAGCPPSCWVAMPERRWELALWPHNCEAEWESNDRRFRATQGSQVLKAIRMHEEWTLMLVVELAATVVGCLQRA